MQLNLDLLDNSRGRLTPTKEFEAELNAHGSYHSERFVLRLSPVVRAQLNRHPGRLSIVTGMDFDLAQAMSTQLHETIHWWQHVGTTAGLMLSLSYPAQAHVNQNHLKRILKEFGPKKSLRKLAMGIPPTKDPDSAAGSLSIVVNNQADLNFYRTMATNPALIRKLAEDPYFLNVGHAFEMAIGNVIAVLASTFDEQCQFLPDPRKWEPLFQKLKDEKVEGFYDGSPIGIPPLGAFEIFEGQARFSQLLYLFGSSGGKLSWDDAERMLQGVYVKAFKLFLQLAELDWPASIGDPAVALFLLICDLALNPGEGFPLPLTRPERLIEDADPGIRFAYLSRVVRLKYPQAAKIIRSYSKDEYIEVSERLAAEFGFYSPLAICKEFQRWAENGPEFRALMERHKTFELDSKNAPVQLLFAHTLAFSKDKLERPEFFCWTGAHLSGERLSEANGHLFLRHSARFVDREDDETVVPTLPDGIEESVAHDAFQTFFAGLSLYDLTRQWIAEDGPFHCDYRWLQPAGTPEDFRRWCNGQFKAVYGVDLDDFELL